ncbi:MAG: hypothetical protein JW765_07990 [Deltaproteobacteria bacterium]|nr:hypothetical protein [Candidatus Zymogenaceae bacterium]
MVKTTTASAENGPQSKRARLFGLSAAIGVGIILSVAGAWVVYGSAEGIIGTREPLEVGSEAATPPGAAYPDIWSTGEEFVNGLMNGSIRSETGVRIVSQLFINASDGVLTKEEIGSILQQMRRVHGMSL